MLFYGYLIMAFYINVGLSGSSHLKAISNLDPLIITATPTWNLFENPRCPHAYSILTDQIFHTTVYNHIVKYSKFLACVYNSHSANRLQR